MFPFIKTRKLRHFELINFKLNFKLMVFFYVLINLTIWSIFNFYFISFYYRIW